MGPFEVASKDATVVQGTGRDDGRRAGGEALTSVSVTTYFASSGAPQRSVPRKVVGSAVRRAGEAMAATVLESSRQPAMGAAARTAPEKSRIDRDGRRAMRAARCVQEADARRQIRRERVLRRS